MTDSNDDNNGRVTMAVLNSQLTSLKEDVYKLTKAVESLQGEMRKKPDENDKAIQELRLKLQRMEDRFEPIRLVVFGLAGIVLSSVGYALINIVVK